MKIAKGKVMWSLSSILFLPEAWTTVRAVSLKKGIPPPLSEPSRRVPCSSRQGGLIGLDPLCSACLQTLAATNRQRSGRKENLLLDQRWQWGDG